MGAPPLARPPLLAMRANGEGGVGGVALEPAWGAVVAAAGSNAPPRALRRARASHLGAVGVGGGRDGGPPAALFLFFRPAEQQAGLTSSTNGA